MPPLPSSRSRRKRPATTAPASSLVTWSRASAPMEPRYQSSAGVSAPLHQAMLEQLVVERPSTHSEQAGGELLVVAGVGERPLDGAALGPPHRLVEAHEWLAGNRDAGGDGAPGLGRKGRAGLELALDVGRRE